MPQDETVITLTGLSGPAGIPLRFSGFIGIIIGPILILSSRKYLGVLNKQCDQIGLFLRDLGSTFSDLATGRTVFKHTF